MTKFATSPFSTGMMRLGGLLLVWWSAQAVAAPSLWAVPGPGVVATRLTVETELSVHRMAAPTSLAPDLTIGVADGFALAMHHSRASHAQIGAGNGICLLGPRETLDVDDDARCSESATGLGLALYSRIPTSVLRTGFAVRGPGALAIELGSASRWQHSRVWVTLAPTLVVAATGRDRGNRERIQTAAYLGMSVGNFEVHARTGIEGALETFEETFAVPVGAGLSMRTGAFAIGVDAGLDRAFGALNTIRWRSASLFFEYWIGGGS